MNNLRGLKMGLIVYLENQNIVFVFCLGQEIVNSDLGHMPKSHTF